MLPVSEKARMCRKSIVYIGFNTLPGFRHPQGPWDLSPWTRGTTLPRSSLLSFQLSCACVCFSGDKELLLCSILLSLIKIKLCSNSYISISSNFE